jgi:hypothetical protein
VLPESEVVPVVPSGGGAVLVGSGGGVVLVGSGGGVVPPESELVVSVVPVESGGVVLVGSVAVASPESAASVVLVVAAATLSGSLATADTAALAFGTRASDAAAAKTLITSRTTEEHRRGVPLSGEIFTRCELFVHQASARKGCYERTPRWAVDTTLLRRGGRRLESRPAVPVKRVS